MHAEEQAKSQGAKGEGHAQGLEVAIEFGVVGVGFGLHGFSSGAGRCAVMDS